MATLTDVKAELIQRVEAMDADTAVRLPAMLSLEGDTGEVTEEERAEIDEGREAVRRGDVVDGEAFERELGVEIYKG